MNEISSVIVCIETLQSQKEKLKGLVRYSRKELKRVQRKLKETSLESLNKTDKIEELNRTIQNLKEKIDLQDGKLKYYKKQEIEMSLMQNSFRSNISDDLNMKLINQNQEILDRFYREEERVRELEEEITLIENEKKKLEKRNEKLKKEIYKMKMDNEDKDDEAELRDMKAEIMLLNNIKERLEEDEHKFKERIQILTIERNTYEKKLNDLIDEHNILIENYEKQIDSLKKSQKNNSSYDKSSKKYDYRMNLSDDEDDDNHQRSRVLEKEIEHLRSENAQLKNQVYNSKEKHMTLMNKYYDLKKKIQSEICN